MVTSSQSVLIVEDERMIRTTLRMYLEDSGFEVAEAATGGEAIDILENTPICAGIVDLRLADMHGAEVIRAAREVQPAAKFVIHTGAPEYDLPAELTRLGMRDEDVFLKPVSDLSVLVDRVLALIQDRDRET